MRAALALVLLLFATAASAVIETYDFDSPQQRERYNRFIEELRCPKCQNQNLAGSDAPIAADLRKQLHQQLVSGRSDREIRQYMLDRYGDFILYRPRFNSNTALLWLLPLLMLLLGAGVWGFQLRANRRQRSTTSAELSSDEQHKLAQLLEDDRND